MSYNFQGSKNKELLEKALNYNIWLVAGRKNVQKIKQITNDLSNSIESVNIIPWDQNGNQVTNRMPGVCTANLVTGKSNIEMKGYIHAPDFKHNWIEHEFVHELAHATTDMMNAKHSITENGERKVKIVNGERLFAGGATIVSIDKERRYGKAFSETIMDMIASIGLAEFDEGFKRRNAGVNADTILERPVDEWADNAQSGYSVMTSITRLAVAAFANEPEVNYHEIISKGESMFSVETMRRTGKWIPVNDFLYGMMYDPFHCMEEYDKYMGEGAYIELLKKTDIIYEQVLADQEIDSDTVKEIMVDIPRFANKKKSKSLQNWTFTRDEANKLVGKFNRIWNGMQHEYKAYFSREEIQKI